MNNDTGTHERVPALPEDPFDFVRSIAVRLPGCHDDTLIDPHILNDLSDLDLQPVRVKRPHKQQPNFSGFQFHSGLGRQVWFESRLEQQFLQLSEADPTIRNIVAQPFRIVWDHPDLTTHVPDYLVSHINGRTRIVNVKPPDRVADSQQLFDLIDAVARSSRIESEVFTGVGAGERQTASFLHRFRLQPCETERSLPKQFTLRWVYEQNDPVLTRTAMTALAHHQLAIADGPDAPLDDDSILVHVEARR